MRNCVLILLFLLLGLPVLAQFDQYGGLMSAPSPNPSTEYFRVEKFGNRWMFVTPANYAYWLQGVYGLDVLQDQDPQGHSAYNTAYSKYTSPTLGWANAQLQRMKNWGFNTNMAGSVYTRPFHADGAWPGDHYIPTKLPYFAMYMNSKYAMSRQWPYISEGVKDWQNFINRSYDAYWKPSEGEADYYDPDLWTFLDDMVVNDSFLTEFNAAPAAYKKYLLGIAIDESDQTYSFDVGSDFTIDPMWGVDPHGHGGYRVAVTSPIQVANNGYRKGFVYTDTTVYVKQAWRDYLKTVYSNSIGALNTAWGSNYTTWDSSGTTYTNEAVTLSPAPNGSNLGPFTFTLAHANKLSWFTLQLSKAGVAVAGDAGTWPLDNTVTSGTLWGSSVASGSVNYTTGAVSITFAAGNAPTTQNFTVSYAVNAWGQGTGLLDEDGRHTSWMGTDATYLTGMNANTKTDVENFLYEMAKHYMQQGKTIINTRFPGILYTGTDTMGGYGVMAPCPVLKAAGETVDFIQLNFDEAADITQAKLDFIRSCYGDRPYSTLLFSSANPDSALNAYSGTNTFSTQTARGAAYSDLLAAMQAAQSGGTYPMIGVSHYLYYDSWAFHMNWALVSVRDNAYDGHEAVTSTVTCSATLPALCGANGNQTCSCGGEQTNYGDVITGVTQGNARWLALFNGGGGGNPVVIKGATLKGVTVK